MSEPISISFLCLTFGRVHLLEEAVESFLRMKYEGKKEMLIVNDNEWQHLVYEHPEIRIINLKEQYRMWGEKEDYGIRECKYDTIAQFDNDDIDLPWHADNINKYFPGHNLLHWNKGILSVSNIIKALGVCGNSGIVFNKETWRMVGGYPKRNCGADLDFVINIQNAGGKVARVVPPDEEVSHIYRWGVSHHLSGLGDDEGRPEEEQTVARHRRYIESQRLIGLEPEGIVKLNPNWKHDYVQMLKDFIK